MKGSRKFLQVLVKQRFWYFQAKDNDSFFEPVIILRAKATVGPGVIIEASTLRSDPVYVALEITEQEMTKENIVLVDYQILAINSLKNY